MLCYNIGMTDETDKKRRALSDDEKDLLIGACTVPNCKSCPQLIIYVEEIGNRWVAEAQGRIEAVLNETEWNDWPGRHRLMQRIRAAAEYDDNRPEGGE